MAGAIYLLQNDGRLVEMREQNYNSEGLLQKLLAEYPDLLAGDQMSDGEPRRWLLIGRELPVPGEEGAGGRWFLDHLFVDQEGIPTLVEVKRSSDSRLRREVVGQLLEYAANAAAYWPVKGLKERFEREQTEKGLEPEEALTDFLGPGADPEDFWQRVGTNLRAGKLRLLFVADQIPPELRRLVEFLDEQMDPAEVLAMEVKQYVGQGLTTLVPRLVGQASRTGRPGGRTPPRQWDEPSFFSALGCRGDATDVEAAKEILRWARTRGLGVWWGKGSKMGSFVPWFQHDGREHQLFAVRTDANVEIYFYWYQYKPPFDDEAKRRELLQRLNEIPGITIPADAIVKRPGIPLKALADPRSRDLFLAVYEWYMQETRGR